MAKKEKIEDIIAEIKAKWEGQNDFPKWSADMKIMHALSDEFVAIAEKYSEYCQDYERTFMKAKLSDYDEAYLKGIGYTNPSAFLHGMKFAFELIEKKMDEAAANGYVYPELHARDFIKKALKRNEMAQIQKEIQERNTP